MRGITVLTAATAALLLAGCQTTNVTYQRIGYGPELEYAKAQCEIASMSVEQGMIAFGSTEYVAGAQLGNALGNAMRKQQFYKNCMVLQGWKEMPLTTSQKQAGVTAGSVIGASVPPAARASPGYPAPPSAPPQTRTVYSAPSVGSSSARGNCMYPDDRDSAGRRCGKRSAYSRPGGR